MPAVFIHDFHFHNKYNLLSKKEKKGKEEKGSKRDHQNQTDSNHKITTLLHLGYLNCLYTKNSSEKSF